MKKLTKLLLSVLLCMPVLAGCGTTAQVANGPKSSAKTNANKDPHVKVSVHAELPDTSSQICVEPQEMNPDLTSVEFTRIMGNGINLGNTLEAYRSSGTGISRDATTYEQLWGQPITTEAMIKGYKALGFDTIRIPVAWTNVMDYENGNYVIGKTYLDRVEEIVNWALDAGLYVIINDHWDGGWWGMFGSYTPEIRESAYEMYTAMWTQIGNRFKNYSYKLIFEGGNEELGDRLNDDNVCMNSGYLESDGEKYSEVNKINQTFVDVIRSLGGNNENRFLLIPGYNTDIRKTCDNRYQMPKDTAKSRLLLSVHYYDPSPLCIGDGDDWGGKEDIKEMGESLKMLATRFVNEGYGVIIGEYGCLPQNGKYKTATLKYHSVYLDYCDYYSLCPVMWDTGNMCFYNKSTQKMTNDDLAKLYFGHSFEKEKDVKIETVKNAAYNRFTKVYNDAPSSLSGSDLEGKTDIAIAYLMYADANWSVNYSVGDQYKPSSKSKGLEATDVGITEPGVYSVKLDFSNMNGKGTSRATGFSFSALGIANGEVLHPDWVIEIQSIKVNDKEVKLTKRNYTSSDDGRCTRSNIVNEWIAGEPRGRTKDGSLENCGSVLFEKNSMAFQSMKTYEVEFYYGPAE